MSDMSDMSVNFGRRKYNKYCRRHNNDNVNKPVSPLATMTKLAVGIGSGVIAKKAILNAPTADEVVMSMHKADLSKSYQKIDSLQKMLNTLKEGKNLTDADKELYASITNAGNKKQQVNVTTEAIEGAIKTLRTKTESVDRDLITKKMHLLDAYTANQKAMNEFPADKRSGKFYEFYEQAANKMKDTIVKMFHLDEKDGMKNFDVAKARKALTKQNETLSDKLIAMKKNVSEQISNIKLLDAENPVVQAYKGIKNTKLIPGAIALVVSILAFKSLFTPQTKQQKI